MFDKEFYPTPPDLIAKMIKGVDLDTVRYVLEPSAGKADIPTFLSIAKEYIYDRWRYRNMDMSKQEIMDYIVEHDVVDKMRSSSEIGHQYYKDYLDIDCIERDHHLKALIENRGFRVIASDFLKFDGDKKYDLIIMNPPFSNGDEHLLHAIKIGKKYGGQIICLLNAETIKNPYSNKRKDLIRQLDEFGATYEFIENAFLTSERPTGVGVVIVRFKIPSPFDSSHSKLWDELQNQSFEAEEADPITDLIDEEYRRQEVELYKKELEVGKRLICEYNALLPYLSSTFKAGKNEPILWLSVGSNNDYSYKQIDFNQYLKKLRYKYWYELLHNPKFMGNLTSNLRQQYFERITELSNFDFSFSNICTVQIDILKNMVQGVEDKILDLFESFTYRHSTECEKNIHYFNGWKTNKAFMINKKVIIPYLRAWDDIWKKFKYNYEILSFFSDIEKTLDFLDQGSTIDCVNMANFFNYYEDLQQTKGLHFKYFDLNFYKKGTCHITFTNDEVIKKLNIFGCQKKGWLPPAYGKKHYYEMTEEEKSVILEFDGSEFEYEKVVQNADKFIFDTKSNPLLIA